MADRIGPYFSRTINSCLVFLDLAGIEILG